MCFLLELRQIYGRSALAVTFEVAVEAEIQVYQEIRQPFVTPVPAGIPT